MWSEKTGCNCTALSINAPQLSKLEPTPKRDCTDKRVTVGPFDCESACLVHAFN